MKTRFLIDAEFVQERLKVWDTAWHASRLQTLSEAVALLRSVDNFANPMTANDVADKLDDMRKAPMPLPHCEVCRGNGVVGSGTWENAQTCPECDGSGYATPVNQQPAREDA